MRIAKIFLFFILLGSLIPEFLKAQGIFSDSSSITNNGYRLIIKLNSRQLVLYQGDREVKTYPIAVPRKRIRPIIGGGYVESIILNPWWYPTEATRQDFLKEKGVRLPKAISPNHPLNAMGKVKICLSYTFNGKRLYRIHGTNDPTKIGQAVSRGCFRMRNEDILELVKFLKGGTPVIIN